MDNIKITIENDDVFVCDNCRNEKKNCYKFSRCGYVYLCICENCLYKILDNIDLSKKVTTDFIEFRGKR